MTAIHRLQDETAREPAAFRRRAITVAVAAALVAISASAVCSGSVAAGTADKPRPSPDRLWQTFPLRPQRAPLPAPRPSEAAQTVPVSRAQTLTPPVPELATRSQSTAETAGGGA